MIGIKSLYYAKDAKLAISLPLTIARDAFSRHITSPQSEFVTTRQRSRELSGEKLSSRPE
jgi:hypothetical protein